MGGKHTKGFSELEGKEGGPLVEILIVEIKRGHVKGTSIVPSMMYKVLNKCSCMCGACMCAWAHTHLH